MGVAYSASRATQEILETRYARPQDRTFDVGAYSEYGGATANRIVRNLRACGFENATWYTEECGGQYTYVTIDLKR